MTRLDLELLQGAVDIHIHHGPDLYPRIQDAFELAQDAKAAGMRGVCLKTHNFPTAPMALLTRKHVPGIDIFGSITCNLEVGGVNPSAVEAAIKYEARQIWLPTIDSTNHALVTGSVGQHGHGLTIKGGLSDYARKKPRLFLLDDEGNLAPALHEIFSMIADADIILNLGHISFKEMTAIVPAAQRAGVKRIICDHPFFSCLTLGQQSELADQGVWINFTAGELLPRWWRVSVADFAAAIRNVGVPRAVISSDCGQLHNPPMVEALRITCQLLLEDDFTADEIKRLLHHNPAELLYP
ncbi:MAG: DUF6282 family protein [Xanthobacteraceae bacterium]|jgi:hypothetical protein